MAYFYRKYEIFIAYVALFCMHTLVVFISLTAYIPTDAKCHIDQHKKLFSYRQYGLM